MIQSDENSRLRDRRTGTMVSVIRMRSCSCEEKDERGMYKDQKVALLFHSYPLRFIL